MTWRRLILGTLAGLVLFLFSLVYMGLLVPLDGMVTLGEAVCSLTMLLLSAAVTAVTWLAGIITLARTALCHEKTQSDDRKQRKNSRKGKRPKRQLEFTRPTP